MNQTPALTIKAIIGLGNPGPHYSHTRHNIGFMILDALVQKHALSWHKKGNAEIAEWHRNDETILLIKPQTFMNDSGKVIPALVKQGIKPENILVIHDELEQPFGKLQIRLGGSARGHNGLKSIIAACGDQFHRMRFGISRPEIKEDVPKYVLQPFAQSIQERDDLIAKAIEQIEKIVH